MGQELAELAEAEANTFLGECSILGDIMVEENWAEVDEETVSMGIFAKITMRKEFVKTKHVTFLCAP